MGVRWKGYVYCFRLFLKFGTEYWGLSFDDNEINKWFFIFGNKKNIMFGKFGVWIKGYVWNDKDLIFE